MPATILAAVKSVVASTLLAEVDRRTFDGAEAEDLKGQALPYAVVADLGQEYRRSSESEAEVRRVRIEALAKKADAAEALVAKVFAALSAPQPLVVDGAAVTYCHPATGDVTRDSQYDVGQGEHRQRASVVFEVRVERPR